MFNITFSTDFFVFLYTLYKQMEKVVQCTASVMDHKTEVENKTQVSEINANVQKGFVLSFHLYLSILH